MHYDSLSTFYKKGCYAKQCFALSLFCSCDQNPWKIPAKEFVNNKVAALTSLTFQFSTLLKHNLPHRYFSKISTEGLQHQV